LGKYWRSMGHHAVHFFLRALTLCTLLLGSAAGASAAPISLLDYELSQCGGDMQAARESLNQKLAAVEQSGPQSRPAPEPRPEPQRKSDRAVAGTPALIGGTTSSTSTTTSGGSASGPPPADLQTSPEVLLAASGESLVTSDWLYIPPRFLDGIFRPPRHVVSL
jgi:hypothetical protein